MTSIDRRFFLKASAGLGFASGVGILSGLAAQNAFAADTTGYKALVCIFLKGGMDHGDTVLPYDQASYDQLRNHRQSLFAAYGAAAGGGTRQRSALLPLVPTVSPADGRQFALPHQFAGLKALFDQGNMAVIGNVGPLIEPTNRTTYEGRLVRLPPRLFSHNDQQSTWATMAAEGARYGWGGRFADAALASRPADNPLFAAISATGNEVFLSGQRARQFRVASNGAVPEFELLRNRGLLGNNTAGNDARTRLRAFLARDTIDTPNLFVRDLLAMQSSAITNVDQLRTAAAETPDLTTAFPNTSLGGQLRAIADVIAMRTRLQTRRQVFVASIGGFDSHDNQSNSLPGLQTQIDQAITAFVAAMRETGAWNDVTLFTISDFGRTTIENGNGTDHGWGAHQFVVGGSVVGRRIYGSIPDFDLNGPAYTRSRGRLIPGVSVEQFAGTLGRWFGLTSGELQLALPNLRNFSTADLGFMG